MIGIKALLAFRLNGQPRIAFERLLHRVEAVAVGKLEYDRRKAGAPKRLQHLLGIAPDLRIEAGAAGVEHADHRPIARGEAQLHNAHGLEEYAAGELDAARREFGRSIAADPSDVDGLYNAAAAAALTGRAEEAVELLARAAAVDPARVQVLGRNDQDFKSLRRRPDVRALLGLRRPPPEGIPPPP